MKKIRRGNDFVFAWEIERNGLPEDLSSVLEKHLYLSVLGKRVELLEGVDYDITGNVIRIEVTPTIANILGTHKAEFHYILPDNELIDEDRKCAVDVDAFTIVGSTAQADDPSEFTVTSDMAIAFKGDKGDKGDSFTYADFTTEQIEELKQPATDAAQQADTARTELTTAVNTKLGEADDKIEEMDTTLSTYDGRVTQVESDISQLAGDVNELGIKDAVQGAKIKDIENVISTMNPNQSAQLSVSGVPPLSLPKNASNGEMSIKLEGLTDAGVNFIPTGRVRSVGKNKVPLHPYRYKYYTDSYDSCTIYLKANTTYILSAEINGTSILYERLSNKYKEFINVTGRKSLLFTTGSSGMAIIMYLKLGKAAAGITATTTPEKMQVEESILTTYEPYRETSLYLTAPELRSNGLVKDEIRKVANGYELVKRISDVDGTVLATPVVSPISFGGILNSAGNGTVYHEPIIADAGVYGTNMPILLTDYPIASIEEIIKHENGVDTYLDVSTAVIAGDKLSFTHPSLQSGDLVLFTYAFSKETTNGNITATFYDSNVVKIDTVTGKAYKITDVVTNGVLTRTLTEV